MADDLDKANSVDDIYHLICISVRQNNIIPR